MSTLYLVRHGQASAGTHDYDRLSPLGRRQAELLGQWWARQGFVPDTASHGSMVRQRDTASLALGAADAPLSPAVHEGLNEYNHRDIESHFALPDSGTESENMSFEDYVGILERWRDGDDNAQANNLEPWSQFSRRGWATVQRLHDEQADKDHHVFFTSGGVIATLVSTILKLDFAHTVDAIWRIRNSSITTIHFDGHTARLIDFNTVPHLHSQHDSSLITLI